MNAPTNYIGNIIFSKSTWGRHETAEVLGFQQSKPNMSSFDLAVEYWEFKSKYYDVLTPALTKVIAFSAESKTVENGKDVLAVLHRVWKEHSPFMVESFEKNALRSILTNTGMYFKESPGIGRKQFREKLFQEICNNV